MSHLEHRLVLTEQHGAGRGPWLSMAGTEATRAHLRCFVGPGLDKLTFLTLEDGEQFDQAILFVFADAASVVPHLMIDVAKVARDYAVFVDLLPRVDLAAQPEYARMVYGPLHDIYDGLARHPQLRASRVPHSLRPFVSPWMIGFRAAEATLSQLFELVAPYVAQWLQLFQQREMLPALFPAAELIERDAAHRRSLFSQAADPVWDALVSVVGTEAAGRIVDIMRIHGVPLAHSLRPDRGEPAR